MLLEFRAITYGVECLVPKETMKSPAMHHVITRGGDCTQIGFSSWARSSPSYSADSPPPLVGHSFLLPWESLNKG